MKLLLLDDNLPLCFVKICFVLKLKIVPFKHLTFSKISFDFNKIDPVLW